MRLAYWIIKITNTLRIFSTYFFSMATMDTWTRLSVTFVYTLFLMLDSKAFGTCNYHLDNHKIKRNISPVTINTKDSYRIFLSILLFNSIIIYVLFCNSDAPCPFHCISKQILYRWLIVGFCYSSIAAGFLQKQFPSFQALTPFITFIYPICW